MSSPSVPWRTFAAAIAASLALVALLWLLFPPIYLTNDDITTRRAIEGHAFPGQPETGFVLVTHSALAWALAALHGVTPDIPWWDVVLAAALVWALGMLLALAWTAAADGWLGRVSAAAALLVAVIPLLSGVQFTISATVAGGAGVAAAVWELDAVRPRRAMIAMAAMLIVIAALVRPMGAAAGAAATGLLLAPLALSDPALRRRRLARLASVLGASAALLATLLYADAALYRLAQPWDAYHRYTWMVARLFEWGGDLPQRDVDAIRSSVEWSANDWGMLQRGWGVDPDLHGYDRVAQAYQIRAAGAGWDEVLRGALRRVAAVDGTSVVRLLADSTAMLAAGAIFFVAYADRRGRAAAALIVAVFILFCVLVEAVFKELPFRLFAPIQACVLTAMVLTATTLRRRSSPLAAVIALSLIATVAVQEVRAFAAESVAERRRIAQVAEDVAAVSRLSPSLLVLHSDAFPSERWWQPFHPAPESLPMIQLGYNTQNPLLQEFLSASRRQPLLLAMCEDPSIVVVSGADGLEFVTKYLREHYDMPVTWTRLNAATFPAWRCAAARPASRASR